MTMISSEIYTEYDLSEVVVRSRVSSLIKLLASDTVAFL